MEQAVTECIKEGILSEFLTQNRAEVIRMSIFEYDKEVEERKLRAAEYEAGEAAGRAEGRAEGKIAGEKSQRLLTIKRMLEAGEDSERIQKYTGGTVEEIESLI